MVLSARGDAANRTVSSGGVRPDTVTPRGTYIPTNLRGAWGSGHPHPNALPPPQDVELMSYRAAVMDDPRFKTPPMYVTSNKVDYPDPHAKTVRDFRGLAGKSFFRLG